MKKFIITITLLIALVGSVFAKTPTTNMGIIISEGYVFHIYMEEDVSEAEIVKNKAFARKAVSIACENNRWNEYKAKCIHDWVLENPGEILDENQGTMVDWIAVFVSDYAEKHNVNIWILPVNGGRG